ARARPAQPAGHAPGPDEPRRRDRPRGGRRAEREDRRAGAQRAGGADGGALRPAERAVADAARGRAAGCGRRTGGGVMERLFRREAPAANLVIRGARLFDRGAGHEAAQLDVRIADGAIAEIGERIDAGGVEEIDAAGLTMTPGLVDPHVHLRTPGDE